MENIVLKPCQRRAVNELYKYVVCNNDQEIINFQAPTGSGKTLILSELSNQFIEENDKCIVLFASISTGDIHKQNFDKANKYKTLCGYSYNTYLIESPSNDNKNLAKHDYEIDIPLSNKTIYFIGAQSYTKKSILYVRQVLSAFLESAKNNGYKVLYIRDEAHIGGSSSSSDNNGSKNINDLKKYFDKQLFVSATLSSKGKNIDVQITDKEAIEDNLLKKYLIKGKGLDGLKEISDDELLHDALIEFKKIKQDYLNANKNINPCLLIQISNNKKIEEESYKQSIAKIINEIKHQELNYVYYTSDNANGWDTNVNILDKSQGLSGRNKDKIVNPNSIIDVIIFKVSVSIGYDIPRACMLLQLREIFSENLNIQTIGRIRRNPNKNLEYTSDSDPTNYYYIYSNYAGSGKNFESQILELHKDCNNYTYPSLKFKKNEESVPETNTINFAIDLKEELRKTILNNKYLDYINDCIENDGYKVYDSDVLCDLKKIQRKGTVNNIFEVQKLWNKYLESKDDFFKNAINNIILELKAEFKDLNPYLFKLFLISNADSSKIVKENIKNIYNKYLNKDKDDYYIDEVRLPPSVFQIVDNNESSIVMDLKDMDKNKLVYMYVLKNIKESNLQKVVYYFDSDRETTFLFSLLKLFKHDSLFMKTHYNPDVRITKNYDNESLIKFDYVKKVHDYNNVKASTYPDFLINFNDKRFLIEVKATDKDDYDLEKTSSLIKAYKKFSSVLEEYERYYFAVVKVDTKDRQSPKFTWYCYYQGELYSQGINESSYNLHKLFVKE